MSCCGLTSTGRMRTTVKLYTQTQVEGIEGGYTHTEALTFTLRGEVTSPSSGERSRANNSDLRAVLRAKVRYRSGINENMKVVINNEPYKIIHLDNVEMRNRWLTIDMARWPK